MKKVCFYIHGIGYKNNSEDIQQILKKSLKDVEIVLINWHDIFDKFEDEFIKKYEVTETLRKYSAYYAGDIILYEKLKSLIFHIICSKVKEYKNYELNFVAHSLGSVILSDFLYENKHLLVNNFFSIGSPIAIYSMRYGIENFDKPINNCDNWINIWNTYDSISYPLKILNTNYNLVVNKDIDFNKTSLLGRFLKLEHLIYFKGNKLEKLIKENWK